MPPGTPFTEPQYEIAARAKADALSAEAEKDRIATKFRNPKIQALLVVLALALGVFGLVRLVTLPQLL